MPLFLATIMQRSDFQLAFCHAAIMMAEFPMLP
jgi:hypothetical protein